MSNRERQSQFRKRLIESGVSRVEVWLTSSDRALLEQLLANQPEPSKKARLTALVGRALQALSVVQPVIRTDPALSVPTADQGAPRPRYMNVELEDRILALHQGGLSFPEVSKTLAEEGFLNSKGQPYQRGVLCKVVARAVRRSVKITL